MLLEIYWARIKENRKSASYQIEPQASRQPNPALQVFNINNVTPQIQLIYLYFRGVDKKVLTI